jgi:two-component system chemotaxis sensor kinase CheA
MTIVKEAINSLGGALTMDTRPGKGTRFRIRLPLTLSIMQALIVYIDDQPFAVPRAAIHEVLRVERSAVTLQEGNEVISYGGSVLPIVDLRRLFKMTGANASPVGRSHQVMTLSAEDIEEFRPRRRAAGKRP